jgi:hypothetical protein
MGPTTIGSVSAQNVAVDGSSITTSSSASLNLMGSSESSASGVNIVNAVGSMVANGVNIGYTSNMNAMPTLTQSNSISQSH